MASLPSGCVELFANVSRLGIVRACGPVLRPLADLEDWIQAHPTVPSAPNEFVEALKVRRDLDRHRARCERCRDARAVVGDGPAQALANDIVLVLEQLMEDAQARPGFAPEARERVARMIVTDSGFWTQLAEKASELDDKALVSEVDSYYAWWKGAYHWAFYAPHGTRGQPRAAVDLMRYREREALRKALRAGARTLRNSTDEDLDEALQKAEAVVRTAMAAFFGEFEHQAVALLAGTRRLGKWTLNALRLPLAWRPQGYYWPWATTLAAWFEVRGMPFVAPLLLFMGAAPMALLEQGAKVRGAFAAAVARLVSEGRDPTRLLTQCGPALRFDLAVAWARAQAGTNPSAQALVGILEGVPRLRRSARSRGGLQPAYAADALAALLHGVGFDSIRNLATKHSKAARRRSRSKTMSKSACPRRTMTLSKRILARGTSARSSPTRPE
jgi:hypothetical protein